LTKKRFTEFEKYEKIERQLHVFYKEISALSKKSSNDGVNKFKLGLINNCLRELNAAIGPPLEGFEIFEESLLPSNSDVALILGQYVAAIYAFRVANTGPSSLHGGWFWMVDGEPSLKTREPYHFQYSEK
jgi:hypothetical protein